MILFELRDALALVSLNRPEKMNALSGAMLDELKGAFMRIERAAGVRAVILTGTNDSVFCAGTDIAELAHLDEDGARLAAERGQEVCALIEHCRVPVIAAINGLAAGGGLDRKSVV